MASGPAQSCRPSHLTQPSLTHLSLTSNLPSSGEVLFRHAGQRDQKTPQPYISTEHLEVESGTEAKEAALDAAEAAGMEVAAGEAVTPTEVADTSTTDRIKMDSIFIRLIL